MKKEKVGLFIDLANFVISFKDKGLEPDYDCLLKKVLEYGILIEAKAYGDFHRIHPSVQKNLISKGVRLIHCPGNQNGESKLDDPLMIEDIHDSLQHGRITTYILVTGDAHFAPLVSTMKIKYSKRIIIFGISSTTSNILKSCADEFVPLIVENQESNNENITSLNLPHLIAA